MDGILLNKSNKIKLMKASNAIRILTLAEMQAVKGGDDGGPTKDTSFAHDLFYYAGKVARGIWEFGKTASEYQHSLPPSLKK
jgi:hypothetical protein